MTTNKMNKTTKIAISMLLMVLSLKTYSQYAANDICGYWYTVNRESIVQIYKATDGLLYGKIVWLKEPIEKDKASSNYGKPVIDNETGLPVLGSQVILEMKFNKKDAWEDGEVYDIRNGANYSCYIELSSDKKALFLTAYLGFKYIGKTLEWERTSKP